MHSAWLVRERQNWKLESSGSSRKGKEEQAMKKILIAVFLLLVGTLLVGVAPLAAQNSVDVLDGGPQPADAPMKAIWSTTSNVGPNPLNPNPGPADITSPIVAHFVFASGGGSLATDFPLATSGNICLTDVNQTPAPTLFSVIEANCKAAGGIALLLMNAGTTTSPGPIPVYSMSGADGLFLENTVGSNGITMLSNFRIRINVAVAPPNATGQHNCPISQATPAFVGAGTANFNPNESLCIPGNGGEPSMRVDSQGTIYVESIRGVPGGLDLWRWYQPADGLPNPDGTLPFKYEGQPDGCGITPAVSTACGTAGVAPGGGDGDLAFNAPDPGNSGTPNLAVVSLSAAEVTASHSTDRGDTYSMINATAAHIAFDDRQWIDGFDDPTHVYLEYHDFGTTSQIFVQRSSDEGQNYTDGHGVAVDAASQPALGPQNGNVAGQVKVDRSSCGSRGNLYQIIIGADNAMDNANSLINAAYVGVASDVGLGIPVYAFTDYKIFSCGAGSTCPSGLGLRNLFPALAVDKFGYVYAVWSDGVSIYYSFSATHGASWSPAIVVNQGLTIGNSNTFPWIAADANGHVAIAWYGADQPGDSNKVPLSTKWKVYVVETANGHGAVPAFTQSVASDHVIHTGTISTGGLTGTADRSLLDFFQIDIDPTNHLINIAYDDDHVNPGSAVPVFTRQKSTTPGIVAAGPCAGN
jgi:hypothetical protein